MHMASKENFLLQEIKPQVPQDSFMKIKIIFNMEDQLQEEETDQLITNKDYKWLEKWEVNLDKNLILKKKKNKRSIRNLVMKTSQICFILKKIRFNSIWTWTTAQNN